MPVDLRYNYSYGSALRVWYGCQMLTGIVLALHYCTSFRGFVAYTRDTEEGHWIRYVHSNCASILFSFYFLHIARSLYYREKDEIVVFLGGVLLGTILFLTAFLRFALHTGELSYWRATVIIKLLSLLGHKVCIMLWGGYVSAQYSLARFYCMHFLMPMSIGVLVLRHLHCLHITGRSSLSYSPQKISFFPFLMVKDNLVWCVYFFKFAVLVLVYFNTLRETENYIPSSPIVTPVDIKPEWYFLFLYAILRCVPDKTTRLITVCVSAIVPVCRILRHNHCNFCAIGFFIFAHVFWTYCGRLSIMCPFYFNVNLLSVLYFSYLFLFL